MQKTALRTASLLLFFITAIINPLFAQANQTKTSTNLISEERFIPINGIDQWVTIKGDRSKPAILFLHGGPGSPITPYANANYSSWEKDFIIVQWDQRGTARTFGRNAPAEPSPAYWKANPLTIDLMAADGIALSTYLAKYLDKPKIILFGTSWGSVLGATMALKRPDLFYAYLGHSQVVNPAENLVYDYQKIFKIATNAGDQKSVDILKKIGTPPYDSARSAGKLFRVIKKYEALNSTPAPASMWKMSPEYDNAKDDKNREDGDDYSFINYVGDKGFGIKPMMAGVDFLRDGFEFKIPVYFIQGEEDILTPKEISAAYFKKINAPKKEYFLLPKAAHGFNEAVVAMQYKIVMNYILPMINK
ncbi:alpha/beta hydrolase [Mucilaginibacter sp.]|uniref:alpha/beta hydrolase n=1 Tax=Mucilaginibacter sp. TaxID=1882438 RepID=UPI0025E0947A|nr:alpha/beta hydrolase [Mucilaginibacter sp.]